MINIFLKNRFLKTSFVFFMLFFFCGEAFCSVNKSKTPYNRKLTRKEFLKIKDVSNDLVKKGEEQLRKGSLNEAISLLSQANDVAPFNPEPFILLTEVYSKLGQDQMVLKLLEKATKSNTDVDLILKKLIIPGIILSNKSSGKKSKVHIAQFKDDKKAAVSFCFDDGARNVYDLALPIFDEFGYKATIPVNPGVIKDVTGTSWWGSWAQWKDANKRGFEIANHTISHGLLVGASESYLEKEINGGYDIIKEKIGKAPVSFIFPGDEADLNSVKKALERHMVLREHGFLSRVYKHVFIPVYGGETFSLSSANKLIDFAIIKNLWLIAECHSIKTEAVLNTYKPITEDFIRGHLQYINKKDKDVWVDTLKNVYFYLYTKMKSELIIESEKEKSVDFIVKNKEGAVGGFLPLTVVIDTSKDNIKNIKAYIKDVNLPIGTNIEGKKILLNVSPGMPAIHVSWE